MVLVMSAQNIAIRNVSVSATMSKRWKSIRNHFCKISKHINNLSVIQSGIECDHQYLAQAVEAPEHSWEKLYCMNSINQPFMSFLNKIIVPFVLKAEHWTQWDIEEAHNLIKLMFWINVWSYLIGISKNKVYIEAKRVFQLQILRSWLRVGLNFL